MISIRLIPRVIWGWQDWRYQNKLARFIPDHQKRKAELSEAIRQHRPTRNIVKAQRDEMTSRLASECGREWRAR